MRSSAKKSPDKKNIEEKVRILLKYFSAPTKKSLVKGVGYQKNIFGNYNLWRLARYIFSDILNMKVSDQPIEKVNWYIPFVYQNKYNCSISHEKFGFRIYVYNGKTEAKSKEISEEIEAVLLKAIFLTVPLVEEYAKDALSKGDVIVENRFTELFRPYDYFRRTAVIKRRASQKIKISLRPEILSKKPRRINPWRAYASAHYYEQAAYFCFFSLLEHICLLFLAFRNIPERNDVAKFSNMDWGEKFKVVFDINQAEFKKFYDGFIGLARYRRNPAAHGHARTAFNFYLEGARHMISCTISDKQVELEWKNQENNFTIIENFLKLLKTHPSTKNIFMYLNAGLNISFNKKELIQNDLIDKMSKIEIKEYLDLMMRKYDDSLNMDW